MFTQQNRVVATGTIAGLTINGEPKGAITMALRGPLGDSHSNLYHDMRSYARWDPDGSIGKHGILRDCVQYLGVLRHLIRNHRSWTAVSAEEMKEVAALMELAEILPGWIWSNILVEGIDKFSAIPPGYTLAGWRDGNKEWVLRVNQPNFPCRDASNLLSQALDRGLADDDLDASFKEHAKLRRGVMGDVILEGVMMVGDTVDVCSTIEHPEVDYWRDLAKKAA